MIRLLICGVFLIGAFHTHQNVHAKPTFRIVRGVTLPGYNIKLFKSGTLLRCKKGCLNVRGCRAFVFVPRSKLCWLKSTNRGNVLILYKGTIVGSLGPELKMRLRRKTRPRYRKATRSRYRRATRSRYRRATRSRYRRATRSRYRRATRSRYRRATRSRYRRATRSRYRRATRSRYRRRPKYRRSYRYHRRARIVRSTRARFFRSTRAGVRVSLQGHLVTRIRAGYRCMQNKGVGGGVVLGSCRTYQRWRIEKWGRRGVLIRRGFSNTCLGTAKKGVRIRTVRCRSKRSWWRMRTRGVRHIFYHRYNNKWRCLSFRRSSNRTYNPFPSLQLGSCRRALRWGFR